MHLNAAIALSELGQVQQQQLLPGQDRSSSSGPSPPKRARRKRKSGGGGGFRAHHSSPPLRLMVQVPTSAAGATQTSPRFPADVAVGTGDDLLEEGGPGAGDVLMTGEEESAPESSVSRSQFFHF